ncbi:MAG: hypothetical protein Q9165_007970 [Trypethelium subeluteriae]
MSSPQFQQLAQPREQNQIFMAQVAPQAERNQSHASDTTLSHGSPASFSQIGFRNTLSYLFQVSRYACEQLDNWEANCASIRERCSRYEQAYIQEIRKHDETKRAHQALSIDYENLSHIYSGKHEDLARLAEDLAASQAEISKYEQITLKYQNQIHLNNKPDPSMDNLEAKYQELENQSQEALTHAADHIAALQRKIDDLERKSSSDGSDSQSPNLISRMQSDGDNASANAVNHRGKKRRGIKQKESTKTEP